MRIQGPSVLNLLHDHKQFYLFNFIHVLHAHFSTTPARPPQIGLTDPAARQLGLLQEAAQPKGHRAAEPHQRPGARVCLGPNQFEVT